MFENVYYPHSCNKSNQLMYTFSHSIISIHLFHTTADTSLLHQILHGNYTGALNSEDIRKILCLDARELWNSWDLDAIAAHVSASLDNSGKSSR